MPENDKDDAKIIATKDCSNPSTAFMLSGNHSLQHIRTKKCLHPYWGCPVPSQGETVVLHAACNQERLMFEFIEGQSKTFQFLFEVNPAVLSIYLQMKEIQEKFKKLVCKAEALKKIKDSNEKI